MYIYTPIDVEKNRFYLFRMCIYIYIQAYTYRAQHYPPPKKDQMRLSDGLPGACVSLVYGGGRMAGCSLAL